MITPPPHPAQLPTEIDTPLATQSQRVQLASMLRSLADAVIAGQCPGAYVGLQYYDDELIYGLADAVDKPVAVQALSRYVHIDVNLNSHAVLHIRNTTVIP